MSNNNSNFYIPPINIAMLMKNVVRAYKTTEKGGAE